MDELQTVKGKVEYTKRTLRRTTAYSTDGTTVLPTMRTELKRTVKR